MGKINLTCIECPVGCEITVTVTDGNMEVSGNACPRGKLYATNEVTCPKRVVTSTVRCDNGEVVSVKTSAPVLKSEMFEVMKKINKTVAKLPVKIGDVIIENISSGVNLIATDNRGE